MWRKIAFLDTLVHRHDNHRLSTSVYRKPTHTDQYIAFDSLHPISVKRGLVKCLFDRASRIVTSPQQPCKERTRVRSALSLNGYPRRFIHNTKNRSSEPRDQKVYKTFTVLPYIDGVSQQLKRRLESHGIRTVFRSDTTLRQQLTRPKDPIPPHRRDGIVYNIPCKGCDRSYIGETARPIKERITEHKMDVRLRRTDNSAVAEHAWDNSINQTGTGSVPFPGTALVYTEGWKKLSISVSILIISTETTGSISPYFGCGRYAAMTLAVLPASTGRFIQQTVRASGPLIGCVPYASANRPGALAEPAAESSGLVIGRSPCASTNRHCALLFQLSIEL